MTAPANAIIPTEPLFLGERFIRVLFYAAPRNPGDPQTIVGTFTLMPGEDNILLDVIKGDKGEKGDPSPFWRPEWNSTITNVADLPPDTGEGRLTSVDEGRAWYIDGYWHVWTGDDWRVILGAIPGPPGPTPNITITAEGYQPDGPLTYPVTLDVTPSGTATDPHFKITVPLIVGPPGPSTNLLHAPDVFGTFLEGEAPVYSADAGGQGVEGFIPGPPAPWAVKIFSIPESAFIGGTYGQTYNIIATIIVPEQDQAYYPSVDGHVRWARSGLFNSAQVEFQVRGLPQGSTDAPQTGTLIGKAIYDPSTLDAETVANIHEHWSDNTDPSRAVAPDSATGRIEPGVAMVYYVILNRAGGSGSVAYNTYGSQLTMKLYRVS